jgi:hypothetical protein
MWVIKGADIIGCLIFSSCLDALNLLKKKTGQIVVVRKET